MHGEPQKLLFPSIEEIKKRLARRLSPYSQPVPLTCFSYDDQRRLLVHDSSQLKKFNPPNLVERWNLWDGIESFITKSKECAQEHLDGLLSAVEAHHVDLEAFHIVTWRGVMTRILCAPYASGKDEAWKIFGNYYKGVILLTEAKDTNVVYHGKLHRLAVYGGFKFEQLCMLPADANPDSLNVYRRGIVNNNSEFGIVFHSTLGPHKLLLGAEIDGLDEDGSTYLELKTSRLMPGGLQSLYKDRKLLKWWVQSFLAAVPNIAVGFRDNRGNLESIERISVADIPRKSRPFAEWDPQVVLCFGELVFTWLKQMLALECVQDSQVFRFSLTFDPATSGKSILYSANADDVPPFIDKFVNKAQ